MKIVQATYGLSVLVTLLCVYKSQAATTTAAAAAATTAPSAAATTAAAGNGVTAGSNTGATNAATGGANTGATNSATNGATNGGVTVTEASVTGTGASNTGATNSASDVTTAGVEMTTVANECFECNSTTDASCASPNSSTPRCTPSNNVCFSIINKDSGEITRSCTWGSTTTCSAGDLGQWSGAHCIYCCTNSNPPCNDRTMTTTECINLQNSAATISASLLSLSFILLLLQRLLA